MALATKMGITAEEIFNAKVVEHFERMVEGANSAFIGVDSTGQGTDITDTFLIIRFIDRDIMLKRLANQIIEKGVVSYQDENKTYSQSVGAYTILSSKAILEVNGKSILAIFPNQEVNFPYEAARQKRLQAMATQQTGGR